ncbi:MAG: NrsF family protein [Acidobacteriota bacterium]|nr:NrsF family protein [Acidobacteriota bacterium]
MATNDVIDALVRDLEPVSPLPLPSVRLRRWLMASVAVGAASVAVLGRRGDLATSVFAQPFQAHVALLVLAAVSSAAAALALAIPGEPVDRWRRAAPAIALGAWLAWLAGELMPLAAAGGAAWPEAGWGCVAKAFAIGATPGLLLAIMVGRSAPGDVRATVTFAALAAAAVGALGVELTCPLDGPMHLLLWHAGPVMAVVLSAAVFGRAMFTAFAGRTEVRR